MATISFNRKCIYRLLATSFAVVVAAGLTSCGAAQRAGEGTSSVGKALFFREVKVLRLDLDAHKAANIDASGAALSTVVRVYQLRDAKTFTATDYNGLLENDRAALQDDLLAWQDLYLRPGESRSLSIVLEKDARAVAIAALFAKPNLQEDSWRLVLNRSDLRPNKVKSLSLAENQLVLLN